MGGGGGNDDGDVNEMMERIEQKVSNVSQLDLSSSSPSSPIPKVNVPRRLTLDQTPSVQLSSLEFDSDHMTYTLV